MVRWVGGVLFPSTTTKLCLLCDMTFIIWGARQSIFVVSQSENGCLKGTCHYLARKAFSKGEKTWLDRRVIGDNDPLRYFGRDSFWWLFLMCWNFFIFKKIVSYENFWFYTVRKEGRTSQKVFVIEPRRV